MMLTDREFDILCTAADAGRKISVDELATAILPDCPGPRCARKYAAETAWRLMRAGFLDDDGSARLRYQITDAGRHFLESPADPPKEREAAA